MTKEELLFQKRMKELSKVAYQRGIVTFSDFLNLNELNILHTIPKEELHSQYQTFGGYELAERQMVAFLPDALYYDFLYPFKIIYVEPVSSKFSDDLSHRDYLGALMNLGVERSRFGDLLLDEKSCYIFVKDDIAEYILENFTKVKHTNVKNSIVDSVDFTYTPKYELKKGTVSSVRLDSVISVAFPLSRSKLCNYIESGLVYVNGKLITSNGYRLKENDIISVRGLGRISYDGELSQTRKGRIYIQIRKYC